MHVLSLIFFVFIACSDKTSKALALNKNHFLNLVHVLEVDDTVLNQVEVANREEKMFLRTIHYTNNFERVDYCYQARAGVGGELGFLKVYRTLNFDQSCASIAPKELELLIEEKFYNAAFSLQDENLIFHIDTEQVMAELINLKSRSLEISITNKAQDLLSLAQEQLPDGELCQKTYDDCRETLDRCDLCENGSYFIKDSACATGYSKICGQDRCGEKGMPACITGHLASGVEDYCHPNSPMGFCREGLAVGCSNGRLICE